jgi:hypothetical protein
MYEWHMPGFWVQFMIIDDDEDHRFRVSKLQIPLDLTVILINISNWQTAIRPNEYQIPNPSCNTCSNTETLSRKEGRKEGRKYIVHLPAVFKSPYICLPNTEPTDTHIHGMNQWMNDVTDEEAAEKKDPLKTCTPPQIKCCCYLLHNIKLGFWLPVFLSLLITIHNSSCRREGGEGVPGT